MEGRKGRTTERRVAICDKEMREGFRNCYLGNNLQEGARMSLTNIWEKAILGRENSRFLGPEQSNEAERAKKQDDSGKVAE